MGIQLRGRGYPLTMTAESDGVLSFDLDGHTIGAITSAGTVSATTFSGTDVKATTVTATYVSGAAGYFTLTTMPSAAVIKLSGSASTGIVSASAYLTFIAAGTTFYVPAFTTCGASA